MTHRDYSDRDDLKRRFVEPVAVTNAASSTESHQRSSGSTIWFQQHSTRTRSLSGRLPSRSAPRSASPRPKHTRNTN